MTNDFPGLPPKPSPEAFPELFDNKTFSHELTQTKNIIPLYKNTIKAAQEKLFSLFDENAPIEQLIKARSHFVDQLMIHAWQSHFSATGNNDIALIAVGGYGRAELHPYSDVDILILLEHDNMDIYKDQLESFITFLWDIGIEIGSSVRTLQECITETANDITIATNIVESRLITGPTALFEWLNTSTGPDKIWPSPAFFKQKWTEQIQRHAKNHDTAYNLEPNVKEGPGGLRDLQMIGWVTKRHFGDNCLKDLVHRGFLTEAEYVALQTSQAFLWKVRFALHKLTGRREDRLLFEHQRIIASMLGFEDQTKNDNVCNIDPNVRASDGNRLAVELFMKQYYRTLKDLSLLNEMLLQDYQETLLHNDQDAEPTLINNRFQINKNFIEVTRESVFEQYPFALMEIFLLIQQNKNIIGVRASTIRLIHLHLPLIDDKFRNDIRCKSLFMEIFKQPRGLTHILRQMNAYGVLAAYLPSFGKITGQMQFDLFHIYTVDQHTLFVIRNMRRFYVDSFSHEFPLCSQIIRTLPKPELLYIAGLFHDIAKGRGGDHSKLGAVDAKAFCQLHGLSVLDSEIVAWLVEQHLLMSATAQHKDTSDPDVIYEFATKVGNNIKLDYLYLLTVADMRATNSSVWNSWKDSLLKSLRRQTQYAFQRGLHNPMDSTEQIKQTQARALFFLKGTDCQVEKIRDLWKTYGDDYFLRYSPQEISYHTEAIFNDQQSDTIIRIEPQGLTGGTDIFIKTPINHDLFTNTTLAMSDLRLNIVEAKLVSSENRYALNTYTVLELNGDTVDNPKRLDKIKNKIKSALTQNISSDKLINKKAHRRIECFARETEISFVDSPEKAQTTLQIISTDRTGLLSKIAFTLKNQNVRINTAKITTLGAQVEDIFLIRDSQTHDCISDETKDAIKTQLIELLDF